MSRKKALAIPPAVEDSKLVTRQDVLIASDRHVVKVEVPEWGGHLYVRNMTAFERDQYDRWNVDASGRVDTTGMRIKAVILCACDEAGNLLFTREDYDTLAQRDGEAITRIWRKAMDLSGMGASSLAARVQLLKTPDPPLLPQTSLGDGEG